MTRKRVLSTIVPIALALALAGCGAGTDTYATNQAGFFSGVWHGWIAPVALFVHIFDDTVRIYEANNTGIWYDLGFYIAVISGFGSLGLRRGKKSRKPNRVSKPKSD